MDYNKNLQIMGLIVLLLGLLMVFTGIFLFVAGPFGSYGIGGFWLILPGYFLISTGSALRKRAKSRTETGSVNSTPKSVVQKESYTYGYEREINETARCPNCDRENPVSSITCSSCGAELTGLRKCKMCEKLNPSDSRFCGNCGHDSKLD